MTDWDGGATTWDSGNTLWDVVPEIIGRTVRVVWYAVRHGVDWDAIRHSVRWR